MQKKLALLILAGFILFAAAFVSCSKNKNAQKQQSASAANVNPPGVFPVCREPVTFNVAIRVESWVENIETNYYTKMIEEKCNVKFNFEIYPSGNPGLEKLLVQIAGGGTLPELFINFGLSDEQIYNLGMEGVVMNLKDYYDKWAYYIPQQLEKVAAKDVWERLHSADGNIYFIPYYTEQIGEQYALRGWMNTQWLKNLGLEMPKTTDDFRKVLEAFRDRDPNGNGKRDEIPSAGNIDVRGRLADFLINAFIYNDGRDRLIVNDGKVDVIYNKPEYREALLYVYNLMKDGLILDQLFTISANNLRGVIESQNVATVGFFTAGFAGAVSPTNKMRLEYEPMAPLMGPHGVQWTPYYPSGIQKRFIISRDCRNPEAAFRVGDFMCSEEASVWLRFGRPEIDWRLPRPGEKSMYDSIGMPAKLAQVLPWGATQNSHWAQGTAAILPMGIMDGQVAPDNPLDNERWIAEAVPLYMDKAPPRENRVDYTMFTFQEMEQIKDIRLAINTYVNESLALFIMGQKSIEKEWDNYLRELDRMGLKKYLEITQSGYERAIGGKR